ncbi:hypothetical protein ACLEE3_16525 [Lonsdalea quercina]|uniref:gp53-like domain-containing protein n=1 Tax=Lonsdalea quercina TaxID=71657 RepID=UPI003975AB72
MAELTEKAEWTDGIYQLETSDPVVGGPGGISNRQAQELAYRTRYLKDNLDATSAGLAQHEAAADPHTQYAPKLNPTFSGMPKAPTPASDSNSDQLATTAFVKSVVAALVDGSPAALDTLKELSVALGNDPHFATTITNSIAQKAPLNSPALSGIPTAPTAEQSVNTTQIATTAFVKSAINALVDGSPAALDTLKELSAALGNDANFAATVTNSLSGKMEKSQNGADIPDKARFLENLGLGELAKMGVATGLLATPGYAILPLMISGVKKNFIVQWGTLRMSSIVVNSFNRQKFTFPITFPTAAMALSSSISTGIAPALFTNSSFESTTQTGAEWIYSTAQEGLVPVVSYIAVGY